uniref:Nematode cuticle collagen N-terminal domain-containing protein n=1 Tax=Parascaris univalens TaxID=6257 RepID=A0A915BU36_PARUN
PSSVCQCCALICRMCSRISKMRLAFAELAPSRYAESIPNSSTLEPRSRRRGRNVRRRTNAVAVALAQPGHQDLQVQTAKMVAMASQESLDQTVVTPKRGRDRQRRIGALTVPKAHQDLQDDQDLKDLVDHQEREDPMDQWDLQDQSDDQAQLDQKDLAENKDQQANQEDQVFSMRFLDPQDQWDLQERWDPLARKDPTVAMATLDERVHADLQEKTAKTGRMDKTDPMGSKERRDRKVQREAAITARHQEPLLDIKKSLQIDLGSRVHLILLCEIFLGHSRLLQWLSDSFPFSLVSFPC